MEGNLGEALDMLSKMLENKDTKEKLEGVLNNLVGGSDSEEEDYNFISEPEEVNSGDSEYSFVDEEENSQLQNIFNTVSGGKDKRVTLLNSIKPYMSDRRKDKINTAINMVQLLSVSEGLGISKLFEKR